MTSPDLSPASLQSIAEGLSSPDPSAFERAVEDLREIPVAQLKDLLAGFLTDPDASLALGVARAIGVLGAVESGELLIGLVKEPGKWLGLSDRRAVRHAAVESLGTLRHRDSVGVLLELVSAGRDQELVLEAVKALGLIGSPLCVHGLLKAMIGHPPLALSAAGVVAEIGGEEAFQGLLGCLRHESDMVRSASVWALGIMGDRRAVNCLMRSAGDADPMLRRDIAWAIGKIGGPDARLALSEICSSDPDYSVRKEAARAIESGAVLGVFPENPSE